MTRKRHTDKGLKPKAKQMRDQRKKDNWIKDPEIVQEVIRQVPGFRGRKLFETTLR
jgi:hypothetical protein